MANRPSRLNGMGVSPHRESLATVCALEEAFLFSHIRGGLDVRGPFGLPITTPN
jgi:hypothetical protein